MTFDYFFGGKAFTMQKGNERTNEKPEANH